MTAVEGGREELTPEWYGQGSLALTDCASDDPTI
jgi:hypothetical protein